MEEQVVDQPDTRAARKGTFRRRAVLAVVAPLSVGGLVLGMASAASAAARIPVQSHSPVYNNTNLAGGQLGIPALELGDAIVATCWTRGQNLGSGNVWYRTVVEDYANTQDLTANGWTYGGSVDSNEAFHAGALPGC